MNKSNKWTVYSFKIGDVKDFMIEYIEQLYISRRY
jgi:hypothetical protein